MTVVSGYYTGDPHSQEMSRVNWHAVCNFTFKQIKKVHMHPTQIAYTESVGEPQSPHLNLRTAPLDSPKSYQ